MALQELIDGVWQDVPRPARVRDLSGLSVEEAEAVAEDWAAATSEDDRDDVLRRAGVAVPDSQDDQRSQRTVARESERYWADRAEAAEQTLHEHHLQLPQDTDALVDIAEARIAGTDEQLAVAQARLEDPQRRARLAEKWLRAHGIRIPRCEDGILPWGLLPPEGMDEDDWS